MLRAGSCTPEGTNWSFGVQDATLVFFQVLPVLGCSIKLQEVTASWIFFPPFPSVTEDSHSSGTLTNMWMTCLFNLSVFIVYQLELCIYNTVIFPPPPGNVDYSTDARKRGDLYFSPFSQLLNKFHIQFFFVCVAVYIIATVSLFHPVLMHFSQFYTVLA